MSLYQATQLTPDVRAGLGMGVIDAAQGMTLSWHINGQSALVGIDIAFYLNDAESTPLSALSYSVNPPVYGTSNTGEPLVFSKTINSSTIASLGITNGNSYKYVLKQKWGTSSSQVEGTVTQSSASVFIARSSPTLSVTINPGRPPSQQSEISARSHTIRGNYSQAEGDTLNWFRWQLAYQDDLDNPFYDTGNISGTMDISCTYDGYFTGTAYAAKLIIQTENGVEVDSGWKNFTCQYSTTDTPGIVTVGCAGGTDAALVEWSGFNYSPGAASGTYSISDGVLSLEDEASVTWDTLNGNAMSIGTPWSIILKGKTLSYIPTATVLEINMEGGNTLEARVEYQSFDGQPWPGIYCVKYYYNGTMINTDFAAYAMMSNWEYYIYITAQGAYFRTLNPQSQRVLRDDFSFDGTGVEFSAIESIVVNGESVIDFAQILQNADERFGEIYAAIDAFTYTPSEEDMNSVFLADFENGTLNSGNASINVGTLTGFRIYRKDGDSNVLTHIADVDNTAFQIYDYSALSQNGPYVYYIFPQGSANYAAVISAPYSPCFWNWTLLVCEATTNKKIFSVLAAYRFRYNVESSAVSNNNQPGVFQNFTPYPKVQLAPQNYHGGSLTALVGAVAFNNGQLEYIDTIAVSEALYALSTSQDVLFLKDRKGDLYRVQISAPISMKTSDNLYEQARTITLPWVEVGNSNGVGLYSTTYVGVQSPEGGSRAQQDTDTADATAVASDIRFGQTAYARGQKLTGDAQMYVQGTTLYIPDGWAELE